MRLMLPPAAVAVGDATDPAQAVTEAVVAPGAFSAHLQEVRPALAAFGAAFIWLVFAEYLFNTDARRAGPGSAVWRPGSPPSPGRASGRWSPPRPAVVVTSVMVGVEASWGTGTLLPVVVGGVAASAPT